MIITYIRGGLGNQLFMYALGRALSLKYGVPLYLDCTSGFMDDYFKRNYGLNHFNIQGQPIIQRSWYKVCHLLSKSPCFPPRELLLKFGLLIERTTPFIYDETLIQALCPRQSTHLNVFGYWQNELYFKQFENEIRQDLQITTPLDDKNRTIAQQILNSNAICIHARRLHGVPNQDGAKPNGWIKSLSKEYYRECIAEMSGRVPNAHFFCFADFPEWLKECLQTNDRMTFVTHNKGDDKNYADLWLMSLCKHFVLSNSTFGWWGAWLSKYDKKTVLCPDHLEYLGCGAPAENWKIVRV